MSSRVPHPRSSAILACALAIGCVASEGTDDADARPPDSGAPGDDGPRPDAGGPCPDRLVFTGGYLDWDSTPASEDGVDFATVTQTDDPGNRAMTAPNGRVTLCVPADIATTADFTHPDYLDLRYSVSPAAEALVDFDIRGLTPDRADDLFIGELGLKRDVQSAYALVAVRGSPGGGPAIGASVTLGNVHAGAFTDDGTGTHGAGDQLSGSPFVLFANVDIAGGATSVTVSPPAGASCVGPSTLSLIAGALAATTFACTSP